MTKLPPLLSPSLSLSLPPSIPPFFSLLLLLPSSLSYTHHKPASTLEKKGETHANVQNQVYRYWYCTCTQHSPICQDWTYNLWLLPKPVERPHTCQPYLLNLYKECRHSNVICTCSGWGNHTDCALKWSKCAYMYIETNSYMYMYMQIYWWRQG